LKRDGARRRALVACLTAGIGVAACAAPAKVVHLVALGDNRLLRPRAAAAPQSSPGRAPLLLLAFDGLNRGLLYEMLRAGELPMLSALLAVDHGKLPHAYLDETLLSTLPSSTMAAWATALTGVPPSQHGIAGNEFFIREDRRMAAPAPVSFSEAAPTLAIYTDGYMNALCLAPTVYERMRAQEPDILVWVAMHHLFAGADRLLVTKRDILAHAFEEFLDEEVGNAGKPNKKTRKLYAAIDEEVIDTVSDALDAGPVPDVLTVYLSGTDLYAHVAEEGPDEARRAYMREVLDPAIGKLTAKLQKRNALENRYIVITSDHGHTEVRFDDEHALAMKGDDDPPALLRKAGYRLRPFKLDVSDEDPFNAVLAYGGATAYVYAADRSACPNEKDVCDWKKPPRFEEDVVPIAEAFFKNNEDGALVPGLKGTLDLILTRRPVPYAEVDLPFEVYVGGGKTVSVEEYLKQHPHPTYVAVASRLRDLAAGPHGERAGDVMLLAHNGDRATPDERYYFASRYRSWHGSPSRQDSEVPFIVAHPHEGTEALRARVDRVIGGDPRQQKVTDVLLDLREGRAQERPGAPR
jgi:hypothetical protein